MMIASTSSSLAHSVSAAVMVQMGFTGVDDVLSGPRNFLFAFSPAPQPESPE